MTFSFRVGDFLTVGKLVWNMYTAYADAPEQFRNISQEILSLHIVIQKVEVQLGVLGSDGMGSGSQRPSSGDAASPPTLSTEDQNELETLYDGLQAIVKELDDLLKKYKSSESTGNPIDRLKWGQEDLVGLRERLRSNINLLTTFNAFLANCQLIRIQKQLGEILAAGSLHRRGSVASLHSIASFAVSIGQGEAWKGLCRELHCNGITAEMIYAKKDEIPKLFRSANILSFSGNPDDGGVLQEAGKITKQGKKKDRTPFDAIMEVLAVPTTRARDFVARLVDRKRTLHVATAKSQTNVVKVQVDSGADMYIDIARYGKRTALHQAARGGYSKVVKVLLDRGAAIDAATDYEWTALHHAATQGHIKVVKLLLDRGAAIDATTGEKWTALHYAAIRGHIKVMKRLLDSGAAINATNNHKWTALQQAASSGHIEAVRVLLRRGATISATTSYAGTALHIAAWEGHIKVVKLLLDRGAAINATTDNEWTSLQHAAIQGHIEVVKVLLDRGAAIHYNARNDKGRTVLQHAAIQGHTEVVKLLLDRGAAIDAMTHNRWTALHWAASEARPHIEIVKVLLGRGAAIDATTDNGWTALHHAATQGHIEVVNVLLGRGVTIDATNDKGRTALHEACACEWPSWNACHTEVVKALLHRERGTCTGTSIIHVADKSGDTALHCAARCAYNGAGILQLLLDNGANTDRKNANGETALDIARRRGWERGVRLLTSTTHMDRIVDPVL